MYRLDLPRLDRRQVLLGGVGMGAAAALSACGMGVRSGSDTTTPTGASGGGLASTPLGQPEVRAATAGVLATTLRCAPTSLNVGGTRIAGLTYEGSLPGPTLRVAPGDVLRVRLTNDLPADGSGGNGMGMGQGGMNGGSGGTTNLHTHGLHVAPTGNGDNVFVSVEPGSSFDYEIPIPKDHWGGIDWYHAHHHGTVSDQVLGGMAGAIIVTGPLDEVPEIKAAGDQLLVIQRVQAQRSMMVQMATMHDNAFLSTGGNPTFAVNGLAEAAITMRPGEVQRWRIVNADAIDYFDLCLLDDAGQVIPAGLNLIAQDGMTLPSLATVDSQLMVPGNRFEILVQAPSGPGRFRLVGRTAPGFAQPDLTFLTVTVTGEPVRMGMPSALPAQLQPLSAEQVTTRRTVAFGSWGNQMAVNGVSFQDGPSQMDLRVGDVEEWTVLNRSNQAHAFHIHTNPFFVVARDGVPEKRQWFWDTFPIPPATSADSPGVLTVRMSARDFRGPIVQHCHILPHEDAGMMGVVNLV